METNTTQTDTTMGSAILAAFGGVFSAIGNIWTSSNKAKNTKLEIEKLQAEKEATADLAKQQVILKSLELKQSAYASQIATEKANANLRGVVYIIAGVLAGLLGWAFIKRNPSALVVKK